MHTTSKRSALLIAALALLTAAAPRPGALTMTDKGRIAGPLKFPQIGGAELYAAICQDCHMTDGQGAKGAGSYPALANNPKAAAESYLILRVLNGNGGMPSFRKQLNDEQIARLA